MQRLNQTNINTPEHFNNKFHGTLGVSDMERLWKMAKYFKGGTYLDVGCWDSIMPIILAERYPDSNIYGLDFADKVIDFLAPRFPKVKYQTIKSCYSLPFDDNSVDYVVAGETIEHLEDPKAFVQECLRVLKKGGYFAITTPKEEAKTAHRIGGPLHLWSFDEQDIKDLGFTEIEVTKEERFESWVALQRK